MSRPGAHVSSPRSDQGPRRRRAPRGTLSPEIIVRAAITVADADGLNALTTRRLADELGVRPMSLYTHFRDKDAILEAVAVDLYGRFALPEEGGSEIGALREIMRSYFRLLVEHPVLLELDSVVHNNPPELRVAEAICGCLFRLGIESRTAIGLLSTMARYVIGCAAVYPTRREWDYDRDHWRRLSERLAALPVEAYPHMHRLADGFFEFTRQEAFDFGLERLLGIVAEAATGSEASAEGRTQREPGV
jgi:AcrR family transcriptional regulator